jgi:hypothetical protein
MRILAPGFLSASLLAAFAYAQSPSSITLTPGANPSNYGQVLTLTAMVPSGATGKVTFYDGVSVLGTSSVNSGQADLTTVLLPSGVRQLHAHYSGDSAYGPSNSAVVSQTVAVQPSWGFQPPLNDSVATAPVAMAVADFNGDGKPDMVVITVYPQASANVFLGNGDGTFQQPLTINLPAMNGSETASVAVGDLNGDGKADLAIGTSTEFSSTVSILLGNGYGTFGAPVSYPLAPMTYTLYNIAIADFNGDGIPDIAAGVSSGAALLLGNGDGTFQTPISVASTIGGALAVGDFNGDGNPDLALVSLQANAQILLGNGDGTFQSPRPVEAEGLVIVVADFNGDGKADLATANQFDVFTLLGNGDGTFQPTTFASQPFFYNEPVSLATGDINGDGKADLVLAGYEFTNGVAGFEVMLAMATARLKANSTEQPCTRWDLESPEGRRSPISTAMARPTSQWQSPNHPAVSQCFSEEERRCPFRSHPASASPSVRWGQATRSG